LQRQLTRRTGVRLDELRNRWRQIIARKISAVPDLMRDILRQISPAGRSLRRWLRTMSEMRV
jgi:hypothetical protein